jgi:hypothetical protein
MLQMLMLKLIFGTIFLPLGMIGLAQERNLQTFCVESWKKGGQQIQEQKLTITLSTKNINYETLVKDAAGRERYKLIIRHNPLRKGGPNHNYWYLNLYDELIPSSKYNLLVYVKPGLGKHFFPKEDFIARLYPIEQPNIYKDVNGHYPLSATRVIKVQGFYVIIQVTDYKFSSTNSRKLDSLTVQIEFTNKYEDCKETRQSK